MFDIDPKNNNQIGRGYTKYAIVTVATLADLFDVHEETIRRWIRGGKINPNNIKDIVKFYINYSVTNESLEDISRIEN